MVYSTPIKIFAVIWFPLIIVLSLYGYSSLEKQQENVIISYPDGREEVSSSVFVLENFSLDTMATVKIPQKNLLQQITHNTLDHVKDTISLLFQLFFLETFLSWIYGIGVIFFETKYKIIFALQNIIQFTNYMLCMFFVVYIYISL